MVLSLPAKQSQKSYLTLNNRGTGAGLARCLRQTSRAHNPRQRRRHAMWLTFFTVVLGIALGFALGAVMLESYEEKVRS